MYTNAISSQEVDIWFAVIPGVGGHNEHDGHRREGAAPPVPKLSWRARASTFDSRWESKRFHGVHCRFREIFIRRAVDGMQCSISQPGGAARQAMKDDLEKKRKKARFGDEFGRVGRRKKGQVTPPPHSFAYLKSRVVMQPHSLAGALLRLP